ncbi:MAG: endopeptidase La, partial [Clostridia bacterium]|nr:endopeptidase La [Clostridia bacterium]
MSKDKISQKIHVLPVLPLRGLPVFPDMIIHFDIGRDKSIAAIDKSMVENQLVFLLPQRDPDVEYPTAEDLSDVGTVARVKQILRLSDNEMRVLVEGISRGEVVDFVTTEPLFECTVCESRLAGAMSDSDSVRADAYVKQIKNMCAEFFSLAGKVSREAMGAFMEEEDPEHFSDLVAASLPFSAEDKMQLLDELDVIARLEMLIDLISKEITNRHISNDIDIKVKRRIDKGQREYFLREQIKVINEELGETDSIDDEIDEYISALEQKNVPDKVMEKAKKELSKLRKMQSSNPEAAVVRDYINWLIDVPWTEKTQENPDLSAAKEILEADHYGLEKVKERILEFMAVRKLSGGKKSPILCLVGPPGVGKTSVAKSMARALDREYVRLSLGGVRDEAEIRGHRKTYIGSMPGRIISAMKQAGTTNPLILLDEIDKLSADYKGDPSAALLEVLDREQNFCFRDHYLELEYDLSDVLFVTTANTTDTIDRPLLDRMEVIELSGYTDCEKEQIAVNYIIPKQLKLHGLKKSTLKFSDGAILAIINGYTRESGVRSLERCIEKIFRNAATMIMVDGKKSVTVSVKNLEKFLDKKIFDDTEKNKQHQVGVSTGLAWTQYGGDMLFIEACTMDGSGAVELTGQLGDVMKESAKAAISYIRSNGESYGVQTDFNKTKDIHIHVPEGAVPKDGPSAGITMATAMLSAFTKKKVDCKVAMTGE